MNIRNLWKRLRENKKLLGGLLIVVVCLVLVTAFGGLLPTQKAQQSNQTIPEHDGDVLVDSININTDEAAKGPDTTKETPDTVTSDNVKDGKKSDTYFEEMRATITMDRNQVISMLTDEETKADSQAEKDNAEEQKLKILEYMEKEQNVESVIETKGLPECLVLITDNGVNVTVNKQDLNQSDVAKICDIVMRETGRKAPEIIIQSKF